MALLVTTYMELMAEGGGFERARQLPPGMSGSRLGTTSTAAGSEEPQCFSVDDLVSHPLPGYVVPVGLAWRCAWEARK